MPTWLSHSILKLVPATFMAALVTGCSTDFLWSPDLPYTTTSPIADFGHSIQDLYAMITYWILVLFVLVTAALVYAVIRFRDDGSEELPVQIHGHAIIEIMWTLAPIAILTFFLVPSVRVVFELAATPPLGALDDSGKVIRTDDGAVAKPTVEIKAIGRRWWWAFEYPQYGIKTGNQFAIPDDRPVSIQIVSDTVIHSFWIPRIGGKRDAVPGRINQIWFSLTEDVAPGEVMHVRGQCAEYCGEAHALMRFEVTALDGTDFDKWVGIYEKGPTFADASVREAGEKAFMAGGCIACHSVTGNAAAQGVIGPNLSFFGDRRYLGAGVHDMYPNGRDDLSTARAKLTQWIRHPDSLKPGTTKAANPSRGIDGMNIPADANQDGILSEEEFSKENVSAIVEYLLAQKSPYLLP